MKQKTKHFFMIGRKQLYLCVPFLFQLLITFSTKEFFPYLLLGAYGPFLFLLAEKKTIIGRMVSVFSFMIRFTSVTIGGMFLVMAIDYGLYNALIGGIYLLLGFFANKKIPYSFFGVLLLNALGYLFLQTNYLYFATGFVFFFGIEFFFGKNMELLLPFSKKKFGLLGKNLSIKKTMLYVLATYVFLFIFIFTLSRTDSFFQSYREQKRVYMKEQEQEEFIKKEDNLVFYVSL